ncbi:ABC transporter ATP-binding protein [Clostridium sardiniense]|uniref:ABC transporter ATP-binding protein n=1 Tax=Clostridium sardiniense TaxID=29369 RepID=UPI003D358740
MEYAVEFKNVVKEYKLYKDDKDRFKDLFWGKRYTPYRAIDRLDLKLPEGEVIGILGKNGSGKSTILKMVTGVVYPTEGDILVRGKVSALLELTAGFDGELTGRENIYLKGYSMGMIKNEISEKIDDIIDFSELGEYIEQPVRMYSSGMKARLGFAIAVNIDPDILVVDEALAVGDEIFREKCMKRMDKFRDEGKTILFVSHSLPQMRSFCTKGIWIHEGKLIASGEIDEIGNMYKHYLNGVSVEKILDDIEKYKDLVEIKQSLTDINMFGDSVELKGYVEIEPENKKFTIDRLVLKQDDIEIKFNIIEVEEVNGTNRKNYKLNIKLKDIPKGYFNAEIYLNIDDEQFIRQIWCMNKVGQFMAQDYNLSLIIKNNRLKVKKD